MLQPMLLLMNMKSSAALNEFFVDGAGWLQLVYMLPSEALVRRSGA